MYCKSCWLQEGGMCYLEPCEREESGRSHKACTAQCEDYVSKRAKLSSVIPNEKLVIMSELMEDTH